MNMKNRTPDIKWIINDQKQKDVALSKEMFPVETSRIARKFHRQIPGYQMSPLRSLPNLAQKFGVGGIWVKDAGQLHECQCRRRLEIVVYAQ